MGIPSDPKTNVHGLWFDCCDNIEAYLYLCYLPLSHTNTSIFLLNITDKT